MPHVHTGRDVEDLHAILLEKQSLSAKGQANGYAGLDAEGRVPSAQLPASQGSSAWDDITGKPESFTPSEHDHDYSGDFAALAHEHVKADITDFAHTHDYAATDHNHDGVYATAAHYHDGTYEPADAAIQTHVAQAHAPSNAQKNSDITKAEIEAKLTGEIASHSHAGGSSWEFPVGYVLISTVNTNPATFLGYGTWSAFGAGRMLVGLDAGDTSFDTAEETGGAKTSSAVVNHTHAVTITDPTHNHTQNAHTHIITSQTATTGAATSYEHGVLDTSSAEAEATETTAATTATNIAASTGITAATQNPAGGVASFSIMPPYLVCYFWRRAS